MHTPLTSPQKNGEKKMQSLFFVFLPESLRGIGGWGKRKILFKFPFFWLCHSVLTKLEKGMRVLGGTHFLQNGGGDSCLFNGKVAFRRDLGFWSFVGAFFCLPLFLGFFFGETAVSGGFERVLLNRLFDSVVVVVVFARIHTHTLSLSLAVDSKKTTRSQDSEFPTQCPLPLSSQYFSGLVNSLPFPLFHFFSFYLFFALK